VTTLMRASEITKRPVVTFAGDDIAQIKDIVYGGDGGQILGFTLAGRGLFSGPLKESLPWAAVATLGPDAVMVKDETALEPRKELLAEASEMGGNGGDVLGSEVLTDAGTGLGTVSDVIVEIDAHTCEVVGYEIESSEAMGTKGQKVLIPLPDTISASGQHLVVPAAARDFVSHDLAGFGASVDAFRTQLKGGRK
jgi:sporulation protein YlmC with PRC-barrel domain